MHNVVGLKMANFKYMVAIQSQAECVYLEHTDMCSGCKNFSPSICLHSSEALLDRHSTDLASHGFHLRLLLYHSPTVSWHPS